jgi:hypothetical protein
MSKKTVARFCLFLLSIGETLLADKTLFPSVSLEQWLFQEFIAPRVYVLALQVIGQYNILLFVYTYGKRALNKRI